MTLAFLYIFGFSTWGLLLLTWLILLGMKIQKHNVSIDAVKLQLSRTRLSLMSGLISPAPSSTLTDKIKKYMESSSGHPEVEEIDPGDVIVGVRFESADYPPEFDEDEDDGE